eukprot:gnl/TRDRNA2_/TRDRNA2_76170_c0_seq2.p1 gnl/TRDRNA2_/TRDRNA2_76170_c0~~gnl/TRDRNA2_/TRDRNA2_76170_c0_seq2.p1  ORF type:complete len:251 (+),score=52.28 gnl/TRDRNA2_/TRDRNA2_76170_c0_seq2:46-798(+)
MMAIDDSADGNITMEEMASEDNAKVMKEMIRDLELPIGFKPGDLFRLLDEDCDGELTSNEFLAGLLRLLLSNDFQRHCAECLGVQQIRHQVATLECSVSQRFNAIDQRFDAQDQQLKAIMATLGSLALQQQSQQLLQQSECPIEGMASQLLRMAGSPPAPVISDEHPQQLKAMIGTSDAHQQQQALQQKQLHERQTEEGMATQLPDVEGMAVQLPQGLPITTPLFATTMTEQMKLSGNATVPCNGDCEGA